MKTQKRILVVDDDDTARILLREILTPAGYHVIEAHDGEEALSLLDKPGGVDLVLTDRSMPVMDGMTFLKVMRDRKMDVPTIMVSAFGEDDIWGEAMGQGAKDYLLKPSRPEEVLRLVKKYLKEDK